MLQTEAFSNDIKLKPSVKFCPSPWIFLSYFQYLLDIQKLFPETLEVRIAPYEHDGYIAKLSNEIKGYVISDDSDFFIYDIPGYVQLHYFTYPDIYSDDPHITFKLYSRDILMKHFCMTKETFPIFATLCSNDYLIIEKFPKFLNQINNYPVERDITTHIQNEYFKKVANFILDIYDDLKINKNLNDNEESIQLKQSLIIEEIMKRKEKEDEGGENDQKFKNNLIDSVHEYNLIRKANKYNFDPNLVCRDIIESYHSGNLIDNLVEDNLRKQLYELLISRNNIGMIKDSHLDRNIIDTPKKYVITELYRKNFDFNQRDITVWVNNQFPNTRDEQFSKYLKVFRSNIPIIKKLPYYLIPITSSIRFFLMEKVKSNLFIYDKNDETFLNFIKYYKKDNDINSFENENEIINDNNDNNDYKKDDDINFFENEILNDNNDKNDKDKNDSNKHYEEEPKTALYWYEFESLVASCIAALTFSFLNKRCYPFQREKNSSFTTTSDRNNKNYKDCQSMFYTLNHHNRRSLQLKTTWGIENFQQDLELYNNAIQIYAEFCNIVFLNSNFLQTLRIMETQREYSTFLSMYHYMWEESFYSMINEFKKFSPNRNSHNISFIFNHVFLLDKYSPELDNNWIIIKLIIIYII
ncbi:hypothetical protein PIROE2DRAFT_6658 [Piromyces sp. E2]|nr:hypothetical protein PIROE2DRAFT_6658 [Piromyces sp. E2]|eukprot:OUM66216.1 hypothetical protein PIROE2DRAFT_6658 [Piromyces sp. E2]